jgi:ATP-dependent RNA helicase SUPV3L1/SUV3
MAAVESTTITALLGPTNTGKTHRAVERMLEHQTGMIGLPLRLLAREVYDRVSVRVGERAVALVTGEEKRVPPSPRYWVCTVESMPVDRGVDFLAVDEIQLATHGQRGHVFTDRLLHARGRQETWFLGSDTMRTMVIELAPTARVQSHPRLSRLSARPAQGLGALPPRTAVIAFSAAEVYQLAERLRRRRGGAAVVLGALSPRTRNAQVAMYQAGEVDYLVATDAVGMGLNLDVDHVAFAALHKFDGQRVRALAPAELAQIAGRAGRHVRDGTFGTVAPLEMEQDVAFAVEHSRFPGVKRVVWRNADLDLGSVASLSASLRAPPPRRELVMVEHAEDHAVLKVLSERADVMSRARGAEAVGLLWDVCRIPDFRRLLVDHHAGLVAEIFLQLAGPRGRIDPAFMNERIASLEDPSGDLDALLMRMEFIRTWSYVAHRADWVVDAPSWQARTQRAEDRLSDALHERLVERFVERTGRHARRSRPRARGTLGQALESALGASNGPFASLAQLRGVARPPQAGERDAWVDELCDAVHESFAVELDGRIQYRDASGFVVEVGKLARGADLLHPEVRLTLERAVGPGGQTRIVRRLRALSRDLVEEALGPLRDPRTSRLGAAGRGLLYQLEKGLGTAGGSEARAQLRALDERDRALLVDLGVVLGRRTVHAAPLLEPAALRRRLALCAAFAGRALPVAAGAPSAPAAAGVEPRLWAAAGYVAIGPRLVRADVAERVEALVAEAARAGTFAAPPELAPLLGCSDDDVERIVLGLGYGRTAEGFVRASRPSRRRRR